MSFLKIKWMPSCCHRTIRSLGGPLNPLPDFSTVFANEKLLTSLHTTMKTITIINKCFRIHSKVSVQLIFIIIWSFQALNTYHCKKTLLWQMAGFVLWFVTLKWVGVGYYNLRVFIFLLEGCDWLVSMLGMDVWTGGCSGKVFWVCHIWVQLLPQDASFK